MRRADTVIRTLTVVLALAMAGCATSPARLGQDAEHRQDYDRAVVEYTKALRLKPNDDNARVGLQRAKIRASEDHLQQARRLAATGKFNEALVDFLARSGT